MSHLSISEILQLDAKNQKLPIPEIQGLVVDVFKSREVGADKKRVQDLKMRDASGAEITVAAWQREDLSHLKGKELVISAGIKGRIVVEYDSYKERNTNKVSASATCSFQPIGTSQGTPSQQPEGQPPKAGGTVYRDPKADGMRQGMCFKLAGDYYLASQGRDVDFGPDDFAKAVEGLCGKLIEAAKRVEAAQA